MKISEAREQQIIENFHYIRALYTEPGDATIAALNAAGSTQIKTIWKFFNEMDNIDKTPENLIMFLKLS